MIAKYDLQLVLFYVTLTWWNSHANAMGISTENFMNWEDLKMMLMEAYYPRDEV